MNYAQILTLNPRHLKILDLCLLGWANRDIANHLDMGENQISVIKNSPSFKHEFAMRRTNLEKHKNEKEVKN